MSKQIPSVPSAPAALGPYSAVTEANGFVFFSGQVALDPASNDRLTRLDVADQTKQVMNNIVAILGDLGLTTDAVVKTTIFLKDINDYAAVNQVYGDYFGEAPPARSAVEVANLPGGFLVEIELIALRS
ncbi:MAG: Rid family detoxifying hydrolase [Acidimicrobiia bacterium]|nr:Rid family detoxifying hydrolase [Acidimicrobiia bacterium]MDH5421156.1 Rid family detoxifying hydrolase [Acidimicrobiia bacterium]MDH5503070.1 Rid family detoxifying hydrolase [Acidimicrobiia bacterium]